MPDKYDFSKHLSSTINPLLSPLGFKKKGAKFIHEENGFTSTIWFERSSWNNLPAAPDELSVRIVISTEVLVNSSIILFRITNMKFPIHYGPFFLDKISWETKTELMKDFSDSQQEEITAYSQSIRWFYQSEESLVNLLHEIKAQLATVGLPVIEYAKKHFVHYTDSFEFSDAMRAKSHELYLSQLDPISRFPVDN